MRFNASSDSCSENVLIETSEPRDAMWGPVTGAAVSGASLALLAAALLYACHRKRLFSIAAPVCEGLQRRLEESEEESDCDSRRTQAEAEPAEGAERCQSAVNSDVAAFALKARVVYPISQRYRPLADGASNPSLHEPPKRQAPPSQDSASSLGDDWLSQERDDDDESSQFVSCGPSSKTHASHVFRRVRHYPQTPCHSRVSLLCLTLQELQLHTSQLQRQKYRMFLQVLRVLLGDREHADIIHQQQQQEVELLMRGVSVDEGAETDVVMCSIEEVEKTGREQLERSLQMAVSFAKQLEQLGQTLHRTFSSDVSEEVMRSVIGCLRLMEDIVAEVQASVLKMLLDRFVCWQELSDALREKTALLNREAELMLKVTGQSVQELRADGQLEKQTLRDVETAVNEALEQSTDEIRRQTEELALDRCQKACVRRRKMMKAQSSEWGPVSDTQTDARLMMKVFAELQVRHWHQRRDFELQQDTRISDALCERWMSLCSQCSRRVADLCSEFVLSSVTAGSAPSTDQGQSVLQSMKLTVTNQMQREKDTPTQTCARSESSCSDADSIMGCAEEHYGMLQVWMEDEALTRACLDHFGEQQREVVKATVSRCSDMQMSCALIEEQQHLLILEFQRILAARCFYLRSVREMKLNQLTDAQDSCVATDTVSSEATVIGQNLLHEQLSELEAAADMLQGHAHFLVGHALVRVARLQMGGASARDRWVKERLIDAVCESVYVTRDSVSSLVREYYSRIRNTSLSPHSSAAEVTNAQTERTVCTGALQTQLTNWARKPTSAELHHRSVELKRKCVTEFKMDHHSPTRTNIYRQIRDEEEALMCRLASLARVSLSSVNTDDVTDSS
ncbi:ellis-van Creveld syndrome protein [Cyprinus carpio]|uniref:Ellis-van Creveld syndrome protein n=1 Tax=Cyprinus carpio TaxID=7962 RepID=A0A9Q9YU88_CYPCA|nr:ellis-van Creveld syndrome protein [Cyprinus carpio]